MKKRIIPIFVPHRGCPHDCIFCNQKKITGVSTDVTSEEARNIIEEYLPTIPKDASVEIAFFGGSFTAIDEKTQNELLSVAKEYVDKGLVSDIRMSTRPDCISVDILNRLKEYKTSIIELGVQSMDAKVLHDSARGHDMKSVIDSAKLIKESGINLGLQMMVGLPSDTEEKCIETAKKFIELNPFCVRIYPTLVVKDTGLETLLNKGEYKPFTLDESIQIVKKLLVLFYVNNINVIRVGLQATEDIQLGKGIVDGPYHPAFRELVEGEMIKDYLHYLVIQNKTVSQIEIKTNNKNISKIVGNKKSNKLFFKNEFNINMKTTPSNISEDEFIIVLDNDKEINIIRDIYQPLQVKVNGKLVGASNKRDTQQILEEELYDVPRLAIERMCIISFNQFNSIASMNPGQTKEFLDNVFGFLAIFAAYECMMNEVARFNDKFLCPLQNHSSADPSIQSALP